MAQPLTRPRYITGSDRFPDFSGADAGVFHGVCGKFLNLEAEHLAQVGQTLKRPFSVATKPVVVPDDDD